MYAIVTHALSPLLVGNFQSRDDGLNGGDFLLGQKNQSILVLHLGTF